MVGAKFVFAHCFSKHKRRDKLRPYPVPTPFVATAVKNAATASIFLNLPVKPKGRFPVGKRPLSQHKVLERPFYSPLSLVPLLVLLVDVAHAFARVVGGVGVSDAIVELDAQLSAGRQHGFAHLVLPFLLVVQKATRCTQDS